MTTTRLGAVVSEQNDLNAYQLVLVGAERARQLMRGARPMLETRATHPTAIVLEEFTAGLLRAEQLEGGVPKLWDESSSDGELEIGSDSDSE